MPVAAGEHAGQFVLPLRVLTAPGHAPAHAALDALPRVSLLRSQAWPPEPEE